MPEASVSYWMATFGLRRKKIDIREAASTFKVLFAEAQQSITRYVDGVLADGHIDPADDAERATAEVAMQAIETAWYELQNEIDRSFGIKPSQGVDLVETRYVLTLGNRSVSYGAVEFEMLKLANPTSEVVANARTETLVRSVDPGQVEQYLHLPGWARP